MAQLAIEVRTPSVDSSSSIDGSGKATFLLANLNVCEVYTIHAHFLRRAKNAKLPRTPNDQLFQISDCSRESSSCAVHDIVNLKLVEFQRSEEITLICDGCFTEAHFVTAIRSETVDCSFDSESERVAVTATNLDYFIEDFLNPGGFIDHQLASENAISQS